MTRLNKDRLGDELWHQLGMRLRAQIEPHPELTLGHQVGMRLMRQLGHQLKAALKEGVSDDAV